MESKDVLNSERVCGKHFVSVKPAPYWHKHAVDWVTMMRTQRELKGLRSGSNLWSNDESAK